MIISMFRDEFGWAERQRHALTTPETRECPSCGGLVVPEPMDALTICETCGWKGQLLSEVFDAY